MSFRSLVDLLQYRAANDANALAYEMWGVDGAKKESITFSALETRARAVGAAISEHCKPDDRAVLLYPSGFDFIVAFLGCMYAGVIPAPLYPPRRNKHFSRIISVMEDCAPTALLTTAAAGQLSEDLLLEAGAVRPSAFLMTDAIRVGGSSQLQDPRPEDLAFLQYTSGSTGQPKGVMVKQGNLLHNLSSMHREFCCDSNSHMVSWLPIHHDLGLIFGVLLPLYGGFPASLLQPNSFIQRPFVWLDVITKTRATITGAPNFAFELCVDSISNVQRASVNLSSLQTLLNGAEPVRSDTLHRFTKYFAGCGFRPEAHNPCYGMAEATLIISMNRAGGQLSIDQVTSASLEQNKVELTETGDCFVVGCGFSFPDQDIAIVDPQTLRRCPPYRVGELWVSGPSVAAAYWGNEEATSETFLARIPSEDDIFYLRTGDLAYMRDGRVFITGRLKDLIVIRGRNYYPQDVEYAISACWEGFRAGRCAAFSVEGNGGEELVVVQEVERSYRDRIDCEALGRKASAALLDLQDLSLAHLAFVRPATIPLTSSGKIQRRLTKQMWLEGSLSVLAEWSERVERAPGAYEKRCPVASFTRNDIDAVVRAELAKQFGVNGASLDDKEPLSSYGLDSYIAVSASFGLSERFNIELDQNFFYDYPTIRDSVLQISARIGVKTPSNDFGNTLIADLRNPLEWVESITEAQAVQILSGMRR